MKRAAAVIAWVLAAAVAQADGPAVPAGPLWQPDRTWVFVVGLLEWQDDTTWESFPKEDRRDQRLVDTFHAGGVPAERIVYLQDARADLASIRARLAEVLGATRPGDFLFFYYAGHGWREEETGAISFANWDAGETMWSLDEIGRTLAAGFRGARLFLAADCCHSGGLAEIARRHLGGREVVCLTSSLSRVESTGNWTFTDALLAGLRGEPVADLDGNGTVTLDELGERVQEEMAWTEEQLATYRLSGGLGGELVVAAARPGPRPVPPRRVEVRSEGEWWKALVLRQEGARYFVHYAGYGDEDDEWVDADRIRAHLGKALPAGTRVRVEWEGKWYPGRVVESERGLHHVRYDDYGPEWDEWVGPMRLRERRRKRTGGRS